MTHCRLARYTPSRFMAEVTLTEAANVMLLQGIELGQDRYMRLRSNSKSRGELARHKIHAGYFR